MADSNGTNGPSTGLARRTVLRGLAGAALAAGMGRVAAEHADPDAYETRELRITSWDGTELACTVYEPTADRPGATNRPRPSMLMTHGWGGDRSGAMGPGVFATHGYVVLTYDSRGFGESGGEANTDGPEEVLDAKRLLTWLGNADGQVDETGFERPRVRNAESDSAHGPNPRVGMIGPSYAGGIQLNTAARDDRLDAIVPVIPWYDLTFSLEPNEVVKRGWGALLYAVGLAGTRGLASGDGQPSATDLRHGMDATIHESIVEGTALNDFGEATEAWYRARSPGYKMDAIAGNETPCLTIEGWPDTLFLPNEGIWIWRDLHDRGIDSRLTLYNSGHVLELITDPESQAAQSAAALRRGLSFVDEHLAAPAGPDEHAGPTEDEPVEWFRIQAGAAAAPDSWERAASMPPAGARLEERSLADARTPQSGRTLVLNSVVPTSTSQLSPVNHDTPGTSADFDYPVEEPFEVIGTPTISARVQPLGTAAHLFVKVAHVRDGSATVINNQAMPFRVERDGDAPTEPVAVTGELVAFQRSFAPGDVLRLTVATTDAGFAEARQSAGAVIDHAHSSVTLPVRR